MLEYNVCAERKTSIKWILHHLYSSPSAHIIYIYIYTDFPPHPFFPPNSPLQPSSICTFEPFSEYFQDEFLRNMSLLVQYGTICLGGKLSHYNISSRLHRTIPRERKRDSTVLFIGVWGELMVRCEWGLMYSKFLLFLFLVFTKPEDRQLT